MNIQYENEKASHRLHKYLQNTFEKGLVSNYIRTHKTQQLENNPI